MRLIENRTRNILKWSLVFLIVLEHLFVSLAHHIVAYLNKQIRNGSVRGAALPPTPNRDGGSRILPDPDVFVTKSLAASSISDKNADVENTEGKKETNAYSDQ